MISARRFGFGLFAILCIFVAFTAGAPGAGAAEQYTLDNGMTVILKEQHGSPMVSSMLFVKSGSKYESRFENGITHFLEHLLFDGTANMTREEIDGSISDLGGYINAFTRKELTAYLVLLPKQYIDFGMAVQADMLFNSLIAESELPKERKVVLEEINRDKDSPGWAAEKFFTAHAYGETQYDRPVLGYAAFIENIPRAAIVDYWRRYYIPRNMTLLVIGDFETPAMKGSVENIFGGFDNTVEPAGAEAPVEPPPPDRTDTLPQISPVGQEAYDTVGNVTSTYINFSFAAPHHSSEQFYAMDLLAQYLGMDEVSPLMTALKGGAEPLATEAGVSLTPYEEFSRLEVSAITDDPSKREQIVAMVLEQLAQINRHEPEAASLAGIKTSIRADDIYNAAKLHYYGFMISPYIMTAGWDFIESYAARIGAVAWEDCVDAAEKWLVNPNYVVTVVRPVDDSAATPYEPEVMTEDEVTAYFDTASFPEYDLVTGHEMELPSTDSITFDLVDEAEYHKEVLPSGITVIVKSAPGNEVFAMMVLGKNRSANEPAGQAGITDFVNRCLEKGTTRRSARELADDLAGIGANVTLFDNPWIPYDDRYTTRRFSFMKFETIDEFAPRGFDLFSEMLFYPAFDSVEVENVRQSMIGVLRRQGASPRDVSRDLFYATLFEGTAYAQPIMGTPSTVASITVDDLKEHHRRFYSPQNIIVSIVTKRPVEEVLGWFASQPEPPGDPDFKGASVTAPPPVRQIRTAQIAMEKEQVNMYLGGPLPPAMHEDAVAVSVATSVLSTRLYLSLRERQGLAYSVGAGSTLDRSFGWYYCGMGTAADNYNQAVSGILLEMDKLRLDGPMQSEVNRARNEIWGRLMSAKLSAINQAYYLAVDDYLGRALNYDRELLTGLAGVTREDVRRVAAKYLRPDAYVLALAGRVPLPDTGE